MSTEPNKIIYSMVGVSKFYDKKAVLKYIYLSYFVFLAIVLFLVPSSAAAAGSKESKRPISEQEFLRLFKANETISDRVIPAKAIICALRWAQAVAMGREKLPKQGRQKDPCGAKPTEKLPENGLQMDSCVVEDDFTLNYVRADEDKEELVNFLLETSVEDLRPDLSQIYREAGVAKAMVIPVSVSFIRTEFRGSIGLDNSFKNTIFLRGADFQSVTSVANVSFENAIFCDSADFSETAFPTSISFVGATFQEYVSFVGAKFKNGADFDRAVFCDDAWFEGEEAFGHTASFYQVTVNGTLTFESIDFRRLVNFAEAHIIGMVNFTYCKFEEDVFFIDLNNQEANATMGLLQFRDSEFLGRVYFTNAKIDTLLFFPNEIEEYQQMPRQVRSRQLASPVVLKQRAVFAGLQCNLADFREVEFREYADFTDARFRQYVDFSNAIFEGGVSFYETEFPYSDQSQRTQGDTKTGLVLNAVQFPKGAVLSWNQIEGRLNAKDPETFKRVEDAFRQSGDLEGQNGAMYQRRRAETTTATGLQKLNNWIDLTFWGYGVRPLRLFGWMCALFALFTLVYWTQTKALASGKSKLENTWNRMKFAIAFSLRTTWTLGFGYKNSRTSAFKIITVVHSIGFKVLFILLLQAFANTSPLLNELVGKLVHI